MIKQLLYVLSIISICTAYVSIDDMGAIPNNKATKVAEHNSKAIKDAFASAHESGDNVVFVPNNTYFISAINISDMNGMTFTINGTLKAHDYIKKWPSDDDGKLNIFDFTNMNDFVMNGNGIIDGQGYRWWWAAIFSATGLTVDDRPNMLSIQESYNFELYGLTMKNSPRFHMWIKDLIDVHVHHFEIDVDLTSQKKLLHRIPTFPLNTDGIDPAATNVHIHDFKIKNYDDAIAVKSCRQDYKYCKCSSNMVVENGYVYNSVGLSVGSVPPNNNVNCINNITFKNVDMENPLKVYT